MDTTHLEVTAGRQDFPRHLQDAVQFEYVHLTHIQIGVLVAGMD